MSKEKTPEQIAKDAQAEQEAAELRKQAEEAERLSQEPSGDALLEQLVAQAQDAPEPGSEDSKVVNKGDAKNPAPAIISDMESAGYTYVWNRFTGARSVVNNNMLRAQLLKVNEKKERVFITYDPHIKMIAGNVKCMLHPDDPRRAEFDKMGLATCHKSNLASEYEMTQHMQHRHKKEWAAIEKLRVDRERAEDRDFQRKLMEKLAS